MKITPTTLVLIAGGVALGLIIARSTSGASSATAQAVGDDKRRRHSAPASPVPATGARA